MKAFLHFLGYVLELYSSRNGNVIHKRDEEYWILNAQSTSISSGDFVAMGDERMFQKESACKSVK